MRHEVSNRYFYIFLSWTAVIICVTHPPLSHALPTGDESTLNTKAADENLQIDGESQPNEEWGKARMPYDANNNLPMRMVEKRAWSSLRYNSDSKKRRNLNDNWSKYHESWGKRDFPMLAYEDKPVLNPVMNEKRAWNDMHSSWGKRPALDDYSDLVPLSYNSQNEFEPMDIDNEKRNWQNYHGAWGKRSKWGEFRGSWGKRDPPGSWSSLRGSWGK